MIIPFNLFERNIIYLNLQLILLKNRICKHFRIIENHSKIKGLNK